MGVRIAVVRRAVSAPAGVADAVGSFGLVGLNDSFEGIEFAGFLQDV